MAIQYRDIETAPLPVKAKAERQPRRPAYDLDGIPLGGARAFPVGDREAKKVKASIYQAALKHRKDHADFQFKVSIEQDGAEIWVRRLAGEGNGGQKEPAVTNGDYDYSKVAAE